PSAPRRPARRTDGALPQGKLRAVIEYVEEHLDAGLTLEQMAVAAHLSVYHFARQFKAATGLPRTSPRRSVSPTFRRLGRLKKLEIPRTLEGKEFVTVVALPCTRRYFK